ncbi:salivary peroxidase/catechol oxidase-like isoform X2 [Haliotis cracherodii]|uniref:salivary peroxidase/catechol oxidase-like isoform X2 n=1 Tax=Haliotis cracherodii TaxID=6455 RepID=UPI0039E8E130
MQPRFLLLVVVAMTMGQTVAATTTAAETAFAETQKDQQFLESGVDRLGGMSTSEQHAVFTSTKPKAISLGKIYREKLLAKISLNARPASATANCSSSMVCNNTDMFRSADGSCNNIRHPDWGKSFIPMRRFLLPQYDDDISSPRTTGSDGTPLVSPRLVSTTLHTPDVDATSQSDVTHMVMQWGQFLDHDITNTPIERGTDGAAITCCEDDVKRETLSAALNLTDRHQCFNIAVPPGDRRFNRKCLNFVRSVQVANTNCDIIPAEQMNQLTAYIDASQVYGSTEEEQHELRADTGGLLRTSSDNPELLPRNSATDCVTSAQPNFCFRAGDERVDEHMSLASMHTIWLREHNRVARKLARINPHWDDERLFQETRRILGAMIQHISYADFLPLVLSPKFLTKFGLRPSTGPVNIYNASIDASIRNAFATAAYRFGHSMIRSFFSRPNRRFRGKKDLQLRDSFGNTSIILSTAGAAVNELTRGLLVDRANSVDRHVSPELTDFLFPDDEGNSLDLMALNIQRGRDHGLPGYNAWRRWCGFPEAKDFKTSPGGLVDHPDDAAAALQLLYRSPDDIDLFSGGISERPVDGGLLGNTFSCIVGRQFELLKIGDRFWYETNDEYVGFTQDQLTELHHTSLSRVVCDNIKTKNIQPNAFRNAGPGNDLTSCSQLPKVNLRAWRETQKGVWSAWSAWSDCKRGWRNRIRTCGQTGRKCTGSRKEKEACGSDCAFQQWESWGNCVKGCRYRRRGCDCRSCGPASDFNSDKCKRKGKSRSKRFCRRLYGNVKPWYFDTTVSK